MTDPTRDPAAQWKQQPSVRDLLAGLTDALGDTLRAVLLYGPAARGEPVAGATDLHLLVVLADLELETLAAVGPAIDRWIGHGRGQGRPFPRLVTADSLADAADVFPIELAEIAERHVVLHGTSPLAGVPAIDREHLRLQCERELREKLMRLEEAYALSRGKPADLSRLLTASFPTFARIFRGCLRLHDEAPPDGSLDTARAFCRRAELDPAPFVAVDKLRRGGSPDGPVPDLFARYHAAIASAVGAIDRFHPAAEVSNQEQSS
jgi:hypothetical protein